MKYQAQVKDTQILDKLVANGIYHDDRHYRVYEWRKQNLVCFKFQKFGHKSDECKGTETCAVCAENHRTSECKTIEKNSGNKAKTKCIRCGTTDHTALDRNCPKFLKRLMQINPRISYSEVVGRGETKTTIENVKTHSTQAAHELHNANLLIASKDAEINLLKKEIISIKETVANILRILEAKTGGTNDSIISSIELISNKDTIAALNTISTESTTSNIVVSQNKVNPAMQNSQISTVKDCETNKTQVNEKNNTA